MNPAALVLTFSLATPAPVPGEIPPPRFDDATVTEVLRPCCASGTIAWFVTIRLESTEEGDVEVFMVHFGIDQPIPAVGDVCDVWVTPATIGGLTPGRRSLQPPFHFVTRMRCGGDLYE